MTWAVAEDKRDEKRKVEDDHLNGRNPHCEDDPFEGDA